MFPRMLLGELVTSTITDAITKSALVYWSTGREGDANNFILHLNPLLAPENCNKGARRNDETKSFSKMVLS